MNEERWSHLMSVLESVVNVAHEMWKNDEMTDKEYGTFNGTIAQLEYLAQELREE
jgi:hypothetical protein